MRVHTFMLIAMGQCCAALVSWWHLNRYEHPGTHIILRKVGVTLADFAAEVALLQLVGGRHFTIENKMCSEMLKLQQVTKLWQTGSV